MRVQFTSRGVWSVVLALLLVFGLAYRLHAVVLKKAGLSNDESVTYMCAAATAGLWETGISSMVDTPMTVADLHRFYDRPEEFQFRTVALDMALYDVHPPLYFWLLHIIHVLWGTGLTTGALLNIVFGLVVLGLLLALARRIFGGWPAALVVGVVWYLSPAVVQIDLEARPYQLLALLAIASFMLGQRIIHKNDGRAVWVLFTLVNMLGLLTHLYFAFLLSPGLVMMLRSAGAGMRSIRYLISLLGSFAGMLLLYPEFITFLLSYGDRPRDVAEPIHHVERAKGVVYSTLRFFTEAHSYRYVFLALIVVVGLWVIHRFGGVKGLAKETHKGALGPLVTTFIWWTAITVLFYVVGISPTQAVGEQYFAYIWPLFSVVCVMVVYRVVNKRFVHILLALYLLQLVPAFAASVAGSPYLKPAVPLAWTRSISESDLFITTEAKRTALPRIARELPAALPLYILMKQKPQVDRAHSIAFLHLSVRAVPLAHYSHWLTEAGFTPGEAALVDHYEFLSFTR